MTSFCATYKALLCCIRSFSSSNPDKFAAPVAAMIAALWLKLDPQDSRRNLMMILIMSRALDCLVNIIIRQIYGYTSSEC